MKKGLLVMMALTVFFAFGLSGYADAKPRGGGIKSPKQSYTQTPKKSTDNVSQSNPSKTSGSTTKKPGFFSGGSFLKGMMIGGLAGLLFGSMFGTGFFANMMGFLINLLAIFALIAVIRAVFTYFRNKRQTPDHRRPY
ncbi:hypothetical protein ACFO9Q_12770 [Paenibacillus sp. GCM10023252]|uniref:hypothetical protein n=1 Tax=Paenibacillus sp. GCM10023252 TaxID=3252649 RepID=UPI0036214D41